MVDAWSDRVERAALQAGVSPTRVERSCSSSSSPHFDDSLSDSDSKPYVLFWCSQAFRMENNEALAVASELANELHLPLVVLASVDMSLFNMASMRQISFILEGISGFSRALRTKKVPTFLRMDPNVPVTEDGNLSILGPGVLVEKDRESAATFLYGAFGHSYTLRSGFGTGARVVITEKRWLQKDVSSVRATAQRLRCPLYTVNTQTVFPILPEHRVYAAENSQQAHKTELANFPDRIRSELYGKQRPAKLEPNQEHQLQLLSDGYTYHLERKGFVWTGTEDWTAHEWSSATHKVALLQILEANSIFLSVNPLRERTGGELAAKTILANFVGQRLSFYGRSEQELSKWARQGYGSLLSPYINLGFISSATVVSALSALDDECCPEEREAITTFYRSLCRREIGYRVAHFNPPLNQYEDLPQWIQTWLEKRLSESAEREPECVNWTVKEWAKGATPNSRWNASTSSSQAVLITAPIAHDLAPNTHCSVKIVLIALPIFSINPCQSEVMKGIRSRGQCSHADRVFWAQFIMDFEECPRKAYLIVLTLNERYMLDAFSPATASSITMSLGRLQKEVEWSKHLIRSVSSDDCRHSTSVRELFGEEKYLDELCGAYMYRSKKASRSSKPLSLYNSYPETPGGISSWSCPSPKSRLGSPAFKGEELCAVAEEDDDKEWA